MVYVPVTTSFSTPSTVDTVALEPCYVTPIGVTSLTEVRFTNDTGLVTVILTVVREGSEVLIPSLTEDIGFIPSEA